LVMWQTPKTVSPQRPAPTITTTGVRMSAGMQALLSARLKPIHLLSLSRARRTARPKTAATPAQCRCQRKAVGGLAEESHADSSPARKSNPAKESHYLPDLRQALMTSTEITAVWPCALRSQSAQVTVPRLEQHPARPEINTFKSRRQRELRPVSTWSKHLACGRPR
jgi:hypothetical protein